MAKIVTPSSSIGNNAKGAGGYTRYWNPLAGEPWLYNPSSTHSVLGTFISYEDPHSVAERAVAVLSGHLRGVTAWEISQDDDAHDLVNAISGQLLH